jgi:hypothetical protein
MKLIGLTVIVTEEPAVEFCSFAFRSSRSICFFFFLLSFLFAFSRFFSSFSNFLSCSDFSLSSFCFFFGFLVVIAFFVVHFSLFCSYLHLFRQFFYFNRLLRRRNFITLRFDFNVLELFIKVVADLEQLGPPITFFLRDIQIFASDIPLQFSRH